ncbi:hypothetical protein RJ55_06360 [Drechmeria coniospora]|nr:hypothetical protein RJ55_06360 [Drechmeria coniospora]
MAPVAAAAGHLAGVTASLEIGNLVPGSASSLVPPGFKPTTYLCVEYKGMAVELGNLFRARDCKLAPTIRFAPEACSQKGASAKTYYTLMLVDPESPTPGRFCRHWVLPGLQPIDDIDGTVTQTRPASTEYLGPRNESQPHRYLFLLFREPEDLSLGHDDASDTRQFDAVGFIAKHGLELIGVNWMLGLGDG